jgi:hypothetical protein
VYTLQVDRRNFLGSKYVQIHPQLTLRVDEKYGLGTN